MIDLVSYYLGPKHKGLYQISLMALMYVGLLAYSQVFCGSIATLVWGPGGHKSDVGIVGLPQLVFGLMVVPLSCCDLDEQVAIQSLMATVRFVALFIMIGGSTLALVLDDDNSNRTHPPYFAPADPETLSNELYRLLLRLWSGILDGSLFTALSTFCPRAVKAVA